MRHKNDFGVIAGPTDASGAVLVTRTEIERWADLDRNAFPMDYTGLGDFTGEVLVRPLNRQAIEAALHAHELFHAGVSYPAEHELRLKRARERLEEAGSVTISAEVEHDGKGVTTHTMSVIT
jgi:hypothetical protein